jgi:hypothetical protein
LTPNTTVRSTPFAGAEISTRLAPAVDVLARSPSLVGEEAGAFERDVDAVGGVRQVGGIALGGDMDALAVDDEIVAINFDRAG